ncbi:ABC transporter permease [Kribbella sp. NBC_00709]|uniref:ABC transporter permease n=1 Tax=Kribbella sp. NBC_00709 TaxID=2975972 RepID=UPI002E2D24D3|nr:ABC transporter permease [Kribbella sp. NBC_00709]
MPKNPLVHHPPWRQLLILSVLAPLVVSLAVLMFTWPASRTAARSLPVGVVGTGAVTQETVQSLTKAAPGAFDLHLYADDAHARAAIADREVYGAFEISSRRLTVLTASAAGPAVAQLLTSTAQQLSVHSDSAGRPVVTSTIQDVVATSGDDPRGAIFTAAMTPLVLGGVILAAMVAVLVGFRPAWREVVALAVVSGVTGVGVHLVAQDYVGALPGSRLETWASLSLMLFAISSTVAGLAALLGPSGVALGAVAMVFVGNPFSAVSSAPELLPKAVGELGQLMPPGAGANLLRSAAYFDGHGAAQHIVVLVAWSVAGIAAIVEGHRRVAGRQSGRHSADPLPDPLPDTPLHDALVLEESA